MGISLKITRRLVRRILQAAAALLLTAAILAGFRSASVFSSHKALPQVHLTAEELKNRNGGNLDIYVVYSEDPWAQGAAARMANRFFAVEGLHPTVIDEKSYASLTFAPELADLTVFLGYMRYFPNNESYLTAYARIGAEGLSLGHTDDTNLEDYRVFITAFSETQLNRGIEKFIAYFLSTGGTYGAIGTVFGTEPGHVEGEVPPMQVLADSQYRTCVFAYPGTDGYSLRALGTLTEKAQPQSVTFWGAPDLGTDRRSIADSWQKVLNAVGGTDRELNVVPAVTALGGENAGLTTDVLPSLLTEENGYLRTADFRFLVNPAGVPVAAEYWLSSMEEADVARITEAMERYAPLLHRAGGENVPQILYLPVIPSAAVAALPTAFDYVSSSSTVFFEPYGEFVSSSADLLYATAAECGVTNFVCNAGYNDIGVVTAEVGSTAVQIGFCGSVGFQNPGVGGKFALNNSLRGMLLLTVGAGENAAPKTEMTYVRASEYGLTEKNAGE